MSNNKNSKEDIFWKKLVDFVSKCSNCDVDDQAKAYDVCRLVDEYFECEAEEGFTDYAVPNPSTTNFTVQIKDLDEIDTDTSVFEYLDKLARNQKAIMERLEKIN